MDATSFRQIITAIGQLADFLCYGCICYCGYVWMFGNKTQAIDRLLGAASGYLIIRKAELLRDFLKTL